jgi:hypothetical protein
MTVLRDVQQGIERAQVRRLDDHVGRRRQRRRLLRQGDHRRGCQRGVPRQQHPQGVVHGRLAVRGRAVQHGQVLLRLPPLVVPLAEPVVRQAEAAGREQVVAVRVPGERPRLADERVDDVPVVDRVPVPADQPRQRVHERVRVPDLDAVGVQAGVHPLADQPAVHRVRTPAEVDQAARIDPAPLHRPTGQPRVGQRFQRRHLLGETVPPAVIPRAHQVAEERRVLVAGGEVATPAEEQGLIDDRLEVAVGRLGVAVLVRLAGVDPLAGQPVVVEQVAVAGLEFPRRRQVVDGRRQAVAAVLAGHPAEFPQGVLQAVGERLERLGRAHRHRLPVRVREDEVVHQVVERPTGDGDAEAVHASEVGRGQVAGRVHLAEDGQLGRSDGGPPLPHPPLERAAVGVEELAGVPPAEPVEQGLGHQPRLGPQSLLDLRPDGGERVEPGAVGAGQLGAGAGQWGAVAVATGGLVGHPCPPGRVGQRDSLVEKVPQPADLAVRDHRSPPSSRRLPMATPGAGGNSSCRWKGELVDALHCPKLSVSKGSYY